MLVQPFHPTSSPLFVQSPIIYIVKVRSCRAEQNLIKSGGLTVLDKMHTTQLNCFLTAPQSLQKKRNWINRWLSLVLTWLCHLQTTAHQAPAVDASQCLSTVSRQWHAMQIVGICCTQASVGGISTGHAHKRPSWGPQALTLATFTRESMLIKLLMQVINTRFTSRLKWVVITRALLCNIFQLHEMSVNRSADLHYENEPSLDCSTQCQRSIRFH